MTNERRLLGLLCLLAASVACKEEPSLGGGEQRIAGQTGDEGATQWRPGGGSSNSVCPLGETAEELSSLDENTELGFSAADTLALVAGSHEARVRWQAHPAMPDFLDYEAQVTPGDLDETLRSTLGHDGTAPRYRKRSSTATDGGVPAYCRGQLELGVTVELRSDSGALDERWRGTLTAFDASEAVVSLEAPTWRGRLPNQPDRDEAHFVNAQEGSLNVVDAADPGSELAWVGVLLRIREGAIDGSVNGWVQTSRGGAFVVPQLSDDDDSAGWVGVVGNGFYRRLGVD